LKVKKHALDGLKYLYKLLGISEHSKKIQTNIGMPKPIRKEEKTRDTRGRFTKK